MNDKQLWQSMLDGDESALAKLYQSYSYRLLAYGSKIAFDEGTVKDAIQDIFVRLWKNRSTISPVNNVRVYLFKALRNRLYKLLELRHKYEKEVTEDRTATTIPSIEHAIILAELKKEQLLKLHYYLQQLPTHQREVIHLRFFQNLKITEIADLMEINKQSVSNSIFRGLSSLRSKFRSAQNTSSNKKADNS